MIINTHEQLVQLRNYFVENVMTETKHVPDGVYEDVIIDGVPCKVTVSNGNVKVATMATSVGYVAPAKSLADQLRKVMDLANMNGYTLAANYINMKFNEMSRRDWAKKVEDKINKYNQR